MTKKILTLLILLTVLCCKNENKTLIASSNSKILSSKKTIENAYKTIDKSERFFNTYVVTAKSGLSVRNKPSLTGKKIGKLPYMSQITILETTKESLTINDDEKVIKGHWVKINDNASNDWNSGYVFNGFLQEKTEYIKANRAILTPSTYNDYYGKKALDKLSNYWIELYTENNKVYLNKPKYTKKRGYSECSGDSLTSIISKRKTLLYINDLSLKTSDKAIESISFPSKTLWPDNKFSFNFNNNEYTIKASGNFTESDSKNGHQGEKEYSLSLLYKGNTQIIYTQNEFNDTVCKIIFIGDIDRDGKPDFIIDGPRDYEEERTILLMSSDAEKGQHVKKRAELSLNFGC